MSTLSAARPSASVVNGGHVNAIKEKAKLLSIYSMMATTAAGSGHPTSCMSAAELVAGVFFHAMKFDPKNANSDENDRFVLSKGHAAPLLYAALAEAGVFPVSRLMTLRQFTSELEGHPTPRIHGVDAATGSLGQGLSVGSGLAIGARMDKSPTRVYVLTGDGELAEGQVWEAAAFAAHYDLDNLTVIADINRLGQSEPTMYQHDMERYRLKFESEGFDTQVIDGHDVAAVLAALDRAKAVKGRPQAIVAQTIKGHGFSLVADKLNWHGKPFSKEQLAAAIAEKGGGPTIPPDPGKSFERTSLPKPAEFGAPAAPDYAKDAKVATREAYGFALKRLGAANPHVVAISGDVKNSTFSQAFGDAYPDHFWQGYIAEQNMVSVAVGLQARGKTPFADTFACFLSRAYDNVRMAAISRANINLCGSHCGVSIGEDGPSQMALEDIAMFRAVHGSAVLYPSDAVSAERLTEAMARRARRQLLADFAAENAHSLFDRRGILDSRFQSAAQERRRQGDGGRRRRDPTRGAQGGGSTQSRRNHGSGDRSLLREAAGWRGAVGRIGRDRWAAGHRGRSLAGGRIGRGRVACLGCGGRGAGEIQTAGGERLAAFRQTG